MDFWDGITMMIEFTFENRRKKQNHVNGSMRQKNKNFADIDYTRSGK